MVVNDTTSPSCGGNVRSSLLLKSRVFSSFAPLFPTPASESGRVPRSVILLEDKSSNSREGSGKRSCCCPVHPRRCCPSPSIARVLIPFPERTSLARFGKLLQISLGNHSNRFPERSSVVSDRDNSDIDRQRTLCATASDVNKFRLMIISARETLAMDSGRESIRFFTESSLTRLGRASNHPSSRDARALFDRSRRRILFPTVSITGAVLSS
mmetsp:Transcript_37327/g.67131  ORF Transcript_37327/g.67131 Transcript_37327/m.67131 type:complete len:212 (-) Transcript_37327:291-926(-)